MPYSSNQPHEVTINIRVHLAAAKAKQKREPEYWQRLLAIKIESRAGRTGWLQRGTSYTRKSAKIGNE